MLIKIDNSKKVGNRNIQILYPGLSINEADSGYATFGRIDQAKFSPGALIAMHPHVNDDILTYLRSGKVEHKDSEGNKEFIEPTRLMLMKAGKSFFHEELVLEEGGTLEALQIFMRPKEKDSKPEVIFSELDNAYSLNQWRLIASPTEDSKLQFSSDTWFYDMKLTDTSVFNLPPLPAKDDTMLFYVFSGEVEISNGMTVSRGESILMKNESFTFTTQQGAELVVFITNENAIFYDQGMYSGNQR